MLTPSSRAMQVEAPERMPRARSSSAHREAGAFIFLGSQTPTDPTSGAMCRRFSDMPSNIADQVRSGMLMADVPDEPIIVQAWRILANVLALLAPDEGF